jgi:hypothetical protein
MLGNTEKYIDLAIKYKQHTMTILLFILMTASFFVGRLSVSLPTKESFCKSEIATIDRLFKEVEGCQKSCKDKMRTQRDKDEKDCKRRITNSVNNHESTINLVTCHEAKAIMPQCIKRGQWK